MNLDEIGNIMRSLIKLKKYLSKGFIDACMKR